MPAPKRPRLTKSKFRLLYLGTDVKLIMAVRKSLHESDYRLVACSDTGTAMMFLNSEIPYDLLLIDLEWRGREGLELAQLARSLPHRKEMPIMLVTKSEVDDELANLARRSGVTHWVAKTRDMRSLCEAIPQMVEGRTTSEHNDS
ncbi:MAG: two-component system, chemotaxis family, chemotaxis protein CheY [Pyrinomonadaceae bacterium]|jgi:CheY-like chemotaxis protein|nr:two-component system, chemotaxis family, chemotaxis protein CheY [Pyrinomonadaceae bacterium]